ncbi:ferritin heavy-chain [Aphelenchoides avenae]|nr:ferritin heavy-chain [Aphelenchus avenae]
MKKKYEFKRENALKLIKYQNLRGGFVTFDAVAKPSQDQWSGALEMFQAALAAELESNEALLDLHKTADRQKDPQLCDELEDYFLRPSVELIEELGRIITNLRRVGNGVGEFVFDTHFFTGTTSI